MIFFTYRDGETRSPVVEERDVSSQSPARTAVSRALGLTEVCVLGD